jgi:hypothetical protein
LDAALGHDLVDAAHAAHDHDFALGQPSCQITGAF